MATAVVLDVEDVTDRAAVEATINTWLTANSTATIVSVDYEKLKRNRGQVVIVYNTA